MTPREEPLRHSRVRPRRSLRWAVDGVLLGLLIVTMIGPAVGLLVHETTGTLLLGLVAWHLLQHARWTYHFAPGQTSNAPSRAGLNGLLFVSFVISAVSGIWISKLVFTFLPLHRSLFLRQLHTASSYWFFLLLGWHLWQHRRQFGAKLISRFPRLLGARGLGYGLLIAGALVGAWCFFRWDLAHRMILETRFGRSPRFDPLSFNAAGHLALLILTAAISHLAHQAWRTLRASRGSGR